MNFIIDKILTKYSNWRNQKFDSSKIYDWQDLKNITDIYFRLKSDNVVISVGNLTFGGTGKTPFLETIVKEYLPEEATKCIIERGYNREIYSDLILTKDNYSELTIKEIGDEPLMLFEKTGVPISISENKFKAFHNAIKKLNPDFLLIDDGFQHRWIERDLDILILDKNTLENPHFPPKGRLREPLSEIKRADVILIPIDLKGKYNIKPTPNQRMVYFQIDTGEPYSGFDVSSFNNEKKFLAVSGIANPIRFFNSLNKNAIKNFEKLKFSDHHSYSKKDIEKIINSAKKHNASIITTEKDFVKLKQYRNVFELEKIDIFVLPIKFKIFDEENYLKNIIQEIYKNKIKGNK